MTKKDIFQVLAALGVLVLLSLLFITLYPVSPVAAWILFILVFLAAEEASFGFLYRGGRWLYRKLTGK